MAAVQADRFFIAIVPQAALRDEIALVKEHFAGMYNCKAALNAPPHITLHMPFQWSSKKEDILVSALTEFSALQQSFILALSGYGCFEPRVIFLNVCPNPLLAVMQKELQRFCKRDLNLFNAHYKDLPFHPHLTIAFRDLKKSDFHIAWRDLKEKPFVAQVNVSEIVLLRQIEKRWEPIHAFPLMP